MAGLGVGALLGGRRPQPWVNLGSHVRPDRVQRYPVAGVLKGDDGCSDSFGERTSAIKWHRGVGSGSEYQRWGVNAAGVYLTKPSRRSRTARGDSALRSDV